MRFNTYRTSYKQRHYYMELVMFDQMLIIMQKKIANGVFAMDILPVYAFA